ncbi:His Kinase A domain containing protein, partial [Entomortierella chlamydospora]
SCLAHQKSIQRRKSEGTNLRISKTAQGTDPTIGGPCLGSSPISVSKKPPSGGGKSNIETTVDQLKASETRTRRISDSGLNTSKFSGSGLAEKLSGFAQTIRAFSRSPFSPGQPSPTLTSGSACSTPTSSSCSRQCSIDLGHNMDPKCSCSTSNSSIKQPYESWDDFLYYYRRGEFPSDCPMEYPHLETPFPPASPHVQDSHEFLPYLAAPLPPNEERRLRALYSFQILQTGIDPNFERIVRLVASVMGVAGCLITLVDHSQVTLKAQYPMMSGHLERQHTICGHTILRSPDDPIVVLDTRADWRFKDLPVVVSEPFVRFYAGAPLTTSDGFNIGALCLVDSVPRTSFTERERSLLVDFAAVVMREMELWNDQVQLCIRNRMMRDITRWVRGCLDATIPKSTINDDSPSKGFSQERARPLDTQTSLQTPSGMSGSSSRTPASAPVVDMGDKPALISPPIEPVFPTPSGSPTLLSCAAGPSSKEAPQPIPTNSGDPLKDEAFPAACILIQASLNVDAVYLVQASTSQSTIPPSGSSVVWNYLDAAGHSKGSVGIVNGGQVTSDLPDTSLTYLASSRKDPRVYTRPVLDEKFQCTKRQGSAWVCTEDGCRPHPIGDALLNAAEPVWERDMPVIKEILGYVRQELPAPPQTPGKESLFTYSRGQDAIENDWSGATIPPSVFNDPRRRGHLCHTFQGTLQTLAAGANTPYHTSLIVPILSPPSSNGLVVDDEPWAYFVILSASNTKQFSFHERIYLKNFGSCLITEVKKRRVEAADKAKGTFIKSISHEFRTPLHIILGVLELLKANPEEPLSDNQLSMISHAEDEGKSLYDKIANIIELAKLDPDNGMESRKNHGEGTVISSPESKEPVLEEIDIRNLCQKVAESLAKSCTDKNLTIVPSWTKPSLSSLSSSVSSSAMGSTTNVSSSNVERDQIITKDPISSEDLINVHPSPAESLGGFTARKLRPERKTVLELIVTTDEPERGPGQDTFWNFSLDVKSVTRILTQLVENAIKFTTTGFVEISATALTHSPVPTTPPHPDAHPILFTVRDTGKGISPEFLQSHLFKRFSQEDPLQVGTGLGMALVKELVKKLGGWMEVWSEGIEGKGCVVKVLVWATAANQTKDIGGPWQGKSCRFYAGEPTVGSDRLFKVMGEQMMGQQLNMNVERGDEQDASPEDMLKDLRDQSRCDLLVFNDDLARLKAYLSYCTDYHYASKLDGIEIPEAPTPLLILTAPTNMKNVQELVSEYLETQIESAAIERPASIVIMTKPIGPIKLQQCLRECFTPAFSNPHLRTPQGSPRLSAASGLGKVPPIPLIRSATVPHITTTTLGVNDTQLLSAGTIIKQSFIFPKHSGDHEQRPPMSLIPPHSPGGLVLPTRASNVGPSPVVTPEHETGPTRHLSPHSVAQYQRPGSQSNESASLAEFMANIDTTVPKLLPQRSIVNYKSRKLNKTSTSSDPTSTVAPTVTVSAAVTVAATVSSIAPIGMDGASPANHTVPEKSPPRVLIVEDNITNRMILRTFLKKRGIGVVEAENGKLGVERFKEEVLRRGGKSGFEFVLMDLQMPIMDGNMATKLIRKFEQSITNQYEPLDKSISPPSTYAPDDNDRNEAGPNTSTVSIEPNGSEKGYRPTIIFALTGLAEDEDKQLAFKCGVDGYMTKPVSLKTLGSLMSSCLPVNTEGPTVV